MEDENYLLHSIDPINATPDTGTGVVNQFGSPISLFQKQSVGGCSDGYLSVCVRTCVCVRACVCSCVPMHALLTEPGYPIIDTHRLYIAFLRLLLEYIYRFCHSLTHIGHVTGCRWSRFVTYYTRRESNVMIALHSNGAVLLVVLNQAKAAFHWTRLWMHISGVIC